MTQPSEIRISQQLGPVTHTVDRNRICAELSAMGPGFSITAGKWLTHKPTKKLLAAIAAQEQK